MSFAILNTCYTPYVNPSTNYIQKFFITAGGTGVNAPTSNVQSIFSTSNGISSSAFISGDVNIGPTDIFRDFSGTTVPSTYGISTFISKLDGSTGVQSYFKNAGPIVTQGGLAIANLNGTDYYFFSANYNGATGWDFSGNNFNTITPPNSGVGLIGPTGNIIWYNQSVGGNGRSTQMYAVVNGTTGIDLYITGPMQTGFRGYNGITLTAYGSTDTFVAKLNGLDGTQQWITHAGTSTVFNVKGSTSSVYVGGNLNTNTTQKDFNGNGITGLGANDIWIARLNPSNGSQIWYQVAGGNGTEQILNMDIANDYIYACGYAQMSVGNTFRDFNRNILVGNSTCPFITCLGPTGVQQYFKFAISGQSYGLSASTIDNSCYIGGFVSASPATDFAGNTLTLVGPYAASAAYIAKIGLDGTQHWFKQCSGNVGVRNIKTVPLNGVDELYLVGFAGNTSGTVDFAGNTFDALNKMFYVSKLNSNNGSQIFFKNCGSLQQVLYNNLAVNTYSDYTTVYVVGYLIAALTPDVIPIIDFNGSIVNTSGPRVNYICALLEPDNR